MNVLETIGECAFHRCEQLQTLGQMNALETIGRFAFHRCMGLTELGDMNALRTIGERAFNGCTGLDKFHIPQTMNHVEWAAFDGCPLREVTVASASFQFECRDVTLLSILKRRVHLRYYGVHLRLNARKHFFFS